MLNALLPLASTPVASSVPAGADWEHPFPPIVFGFITLGVFLALLGALWMFRNTLALPPHRKGGHGGQAGHGEHDGTEESSDTSVRRATHESSSPTS